MCRSLQEQGTEVVIVTTDEGLDISSSEFQVSNSEAVDGDHETQNSILKTRNYKGVPTLFFPVQYGESFKYSRPLALWLNANVKSFDVVHIHAVFNHACLAAASACRRHGVPYVVRPLGTLDPWSMKQKSLRKILFWNLAGKRMLRQAAAVHYTTRTEQTAAEGSLSLNHGTVIPLGVETDLSARLNGSELISHKLPNLTGCRYVLVLSRLHPKKGLDVLVDAFTSLVGKKAIQGWKLVLAGDGPTDYVQQLKKAVAAKNAEDYVLFPGWLEGEAKDAFLRHADLLALPSYHENFGLCIIEALAFGVPVLVSSQVALASEIEASGAGWVTSVRIDALEESLSEALASKDELTRRGNAGVDLARSFSWPRVSHQLAELYESIISRTQPPLSDREGTPLE
jgi:glycosyltransferase involved in cell wall biosynthesis